MFPLKDDIPTRRTAVVTIGLITLNVLVFLYELSNGLQGSVLMLGLTPAEITTGVHLYPHPRGAPLTILTSMFTHGSFLHIAGNMLYLWIFGNNVEDDMGRVKFLAFYLLCGGAAAATQILASPGSTVPVVGASGAIAGVLGAYFLLHPKAKVLAVVPIFFFIRVMWVPAVLFLGFWFLLQLISLGGTQDGGVAFFAHVGGFVAGLILVKPFAGRIWRTDDDYSAMRRL